LLWLWWLILHLLTDFRERVLQEFLANSVGSSICHWVIASSLLHNSEGVLQVSTLLVS
jgi:hypothetical protein